MLVRQNFRRLPLACGLLLLLAAAVAFFQRVPNHDYLDIWLGLAGGNDVSKRTVLTNLAKSIGAGEYPASVPEISIDVKFDDLLTIKKDRARALETGVMIEANEVPAWIETGNQRMPARIRLKGDLFPHWDDANRWSLRVEMKRGTSLDGFVVFSLQQAGNRQFPFDQLFQFWMREVGLATPNFQFFRIRVNGEDWGVMLAEEHMSHQFLELNERKEGAIVKFGNEFGWYYDAANRNRTDKPPARFSASDISLYAEGRYRDDLRIRGQFARASAIKDAIDHGDPSVVDMLDRDMFARALAGALAWDNTHTLHYPNSRFYLNPFTLRLEPVTTDQAYLTPRNDGRPASGGVPRIYRMFAGDPMFEKAYLRALEDLSETLPRLVGEHRRLCAYVPLDCPEFNFAVLKSNLSEIRSKGRNLLNTVLGTPPASIAPGELLLADPPPYPDDIDYPIHIGARYFEDGKLRLTNLLAHPVAVKSVRLECVSSPTCPPSEVLATPFTLPPGDTGAHPLTREIDIKQGKLWRSQRLFIETQVGEQTRVAVVGLTEKRDLGSPIHTVTDVPTYFEQTTDGYFVPAGNWIVDAPITLPDEATLEIAPGTTIRFSENAYLVVRGRLWAVGRKDAPIRLLPMNNNAWKGIAVLEADERSRMEHVEISSAGFTRDGALDLTGAVSFYRSDVDFIDVRSIATKAEDAFNITHADFTMERVYIADTNSDAIDSDFCTGYLNEIVFRDIGGDGLDTSGSRIEASNLDFLGIKDKALSIGEQSTASVRNVVARDVEVAATSKDLSHLEIENMTVWAARFHVAMAYTKKSYFGPATMEIEGLEAEGSIIAQTGSRVIVDGVEAPTLALNVRQLYKAGPMRKN